MDYCKTEWFLYTIFFYFYFYTYLSYMEISNPILVMGELQEKKHVIRGKFVPCGSTTL